MNNCVFCSILAGDISAHVVYEDDRVVVFLSLKQPNPYKVLVIPRAHVETLYDLTDEQASAIFKVAVKIARGVRAASKCEGMNLVQSNGKAGQQDVFHFHIHILPRFFGDKIVFDWNNTPASQVTLKQIASEIRNNLQGLN